MVTQLHKGHTITKDLYVYPNNEMPYLKDPDNIQDRAKIAIKAMEAIKKLHTNNILHLDITSSNFLVNRENEILTVVPIDFGFSKVIPNGYTGVNNPYDWSIDKNRNRHYAPEMYNPKELFTEKTDIYSLGKMIKDILKIDDVVIRSMLDKDHTKRPTLDTVIEYLNKNYLNQTPSNKNKPR